MERRSIFGGLLSLFGIGAVASMSVSGEETTPEPTPEPLPVPIPVAAVPAAPVVSPFSFSSYPPPPMGYLWCRLGSWTDFSVGDLVTFKHPFRGLDRTPYDSFEETFAFHTEDRRQAAGTVVRTEFLARNPGMRREPWVLVQLGYSILSDDDLVKMFEEAGKETGK